MFDTHQTEAERLDRMERETRRRKWDSAIMELPREVVRSGLSPGGGLKLPLESPAERAAPRSGDFPLLELMTERLDVLERKASRLEGEVRAWEQKDRLRQRRWLVTALVAVACSISGLALAAGWRRAESSARRPAPPAAKSLFHAPRAAVS